MRKYLLASVAFAMAAVGAGAAFAQSANLPLSPAPASNQNRPSLFDNSVTPGSIYFPGILSMLQGDMPFLDGEIPAVNGVVTARALAKLYGAIANGGEIEGSRLLSSELVDGLKTKPDLTPDLNLGIPFTYHHGYQSSPLPGLLPGYGHIGLGGTLGWANPDTGSSLAYVHNRLLTLMLFDVGSFAGLAPLLSGAIGSAQKDGPLEVPHLGAPYYEPDQQGAQSGSVS